MAALFWLDACLAIVALAVLKRMFFPSERLPFPPGPKGLPLIGNALDMPTSYAWRAFTRWAPKYGGIIHLSVFGKHIVVLNSAQAAMDLLGKRSRIYSDRPVLYMAGEAIGWKSGLALMRYGTTMREYRRMFSRFFGSRTKFEPYYPIVEVETHRLCRRILERPEEFAQHIWLTAGAIILKLSHGYEIKEKDDHFIDLAEKAAEHFSEATTPGAFLVDTFPILKYLPAWFPGSSWQSIAKEWAADVTAMVNLPHKYVKNRIADGNALPSFTSVFLENGQVSPEKEESIKWAASSVMSGGADTTVSAIHSFILAMTLYPEVRRKAQAELDALLRRERLPTMRDFDQLPYVNAVVKEVLRWNPVGPLGVPHRLIEDDIYDGYLIPEGSIVIPNIWKFLHDEDVYHNPIQFIPERFIPSEGRDAELDPHIFTFGFGRRACPGMILADASVFLACAMVLSVFDISKAVKNGIVIEPIVEYTDATISHPMPFDCSIKPRSERATSLIKAVKFSHEDDTPGIPLAEVLLADAITARSRPNTATS